MDFALVGGMLTVVFIGVVQLGVVLHVRNSLIDCATEGARYGALADRGPADAAQRTRTLVAADLSARFAVDVTAEREQVGDVNTVVVRVRAPIPALGFSLSAGTIAVSGHALDEPP